MQLMQPVRESCQKGATFPDTFLSPRSETTAVALAIGRNHMPSGKLSLTARVRAAHLLAPHDNALCISHPQITNTIQI